MFILASYTSVDGIFYDFNAQQGTATVTYYGTAANATTSNLYAGTIIVPSEVTYDGVVYKVTAVGEFAFANCSQLTAVSFAEPSNVTSIGASAFRSSEALKDLDLPESLLSIGSYAFYGCKALQRIVIPQNVEEVGQGLFEYCVNLQSIEMQSNKIKRLGDYTFQFCESLVAVNLPSSLIEINNSLFSNCTKLREVDIPAGVTTIGTYAFRNCQALNRVGFVGNQVLTIQTNAFLDCSALTSIELPEGLNTIEASAFKNCTNLQSVVFPSTLGAVEFGAFMSDIALTAIVSKAIHAPTVSGAFRNVNTENITVTIPCGSEGYDTKWTDFKYPDQFNVADENSYAQLLVYPAKPAENEQCAGYAEILKTPTCDDPSYTIEAFPCEGYQFEQWSDGNTNQQRVVTIMKNSSLTARFVKAELPDEPIDPTKTYTITYYKDNSPYGTQNYKEGEAVSLLDKPQNEDCKIFSDWARNDGEEIPETITESFSLYSVSSAGEGTLHVVRHINNGEIIDTLEVLCGADVKTTLDADKVNFAKLLSDKKYADIFNPDCDDLKSATWTVFGGDWIPQTLTQDYLHVNINTKPISHKVTFVIRDKQTVKNYYCDEEIIFPVFKLENCEQFDGWYDTAEKGGKKFSLLHSHRTERDTTIYARFSNPKDTIRYFVIVAGADAESGNVGINLASAEGHKAWKTDAVECGSQLNLRPEPTDMSEFIKNDDDANINYRFVGWYTYPNSEESKVTHDMVVIGTVLPRTRYNVMAFDGEEFLGSVSVPEGYKMLTIADGLTALMVKRNGNKVPSLNGGRLKGWRYRLNHEVIMSIEFELDGEGNVKLDADGEPMYKYTGDEEALMMPNDVVIETMYDEKQSHELIFVLRDGKTGAEIVYQRQTYYVDEEINRNAIPANIVLSGCQKFMGWDLSRFPTAMGNQDVYVYGTTQPVEYVIYLHKNGAIQWADSLHIDCTTNPNDKLAEFANSENYAQRSRTFFESDKCSKFDKTSWLVFNGGIIPEELTANIHVNINSEPLTYAVTFNVRGELTEPVQVSCVEKVQFPEVKLNDCEQFLGWYEIEEPAEVGTVPTSVERQYVDVKKYQPSRDVTLIADIQPLDAENIIYLHVNWASTYSDTLHVACGANPNEALVAFMRDEERSLKLLAGDPCQTFGGDWLMFNGELVPQSVSADIHVNINTKPQNHKVTFVLPNGKTIEKQVACNEAIVFPVFLLDECQEFVGWFDSEEGGNKYGLTNIANGEYKTDKDITIYARTKEAAYNVRYYVLSLESDAEGNIDFDKLLSNDPWYVEKNIPCSQEVTIRDFDLAAYLGDPELVNEYRFTGWKPYAAGNKVSQKSIHDKLPSQIENIAQSIVPDIVVVGAVLPKSRFNMVATFKGEIIGSFSLAYGADMTTVLEPLTKAKIIDNPNNIYHNGGKLLGWRLKAMEKMHVLEINYAADFENLDKNLINEDNLNNYLTFTRGNDYEMPAMDVYVEAYFEEKEQHNIIYKVGNQVIAQFPYYEGEEIDLSQAPANVEIDECSDFNGWNFTPYTDATGRVLMGKNDIVVTPNDFISKTFSVFIHTNRSARAVAEIKDLTCETNILALLEAYQAETLNVSDDCYSFDKSEWLLFSGDVLPAKLTSDIHVNINAQPLKHKVTFVANEQEVKTKEYTCVENVQFPTVKVAFNEEVLGWYRSDDAEKQYVDTEDFTTDEDLTLIADIRQVVFSLTFKRDANSSAIMSQYWLSEGDAITLSMIPSVELEACDSLTGWATDLTRTLPSVMPAQDLVAYPVIDRKKEKFNIYFHKNHGDWFAVYGPVSCGEENLLDLVTKAFNEENIADGLTINDFTDQCEEWDGFFTLYDGGGWITNDMIVTSDVHVDLGVKPAKHHVQFIGKKDVDGELVDKLIYEADYGCDDIISLPDDAPDAGCWKFNGKWAISDKTNVPTTEPFVLRNYINNIQKDENGNIQVFAQYKKPDYTIRYYIIEASADAETGNVGIDFASTEGRRTWGRPIEVECGSPLQLKAKPTMEDFVREGILSESDTAFYRFMGWYTYPNGDDAVVTHDMVVIGALVPRQTFTITAFDQGQFFATYPLPAGTSLRLATEALTVALVERNDNQWPTLNEGRFIGWRFVTTGKTILSVEEAQNYDPEDDDSRYKFTMAADSLMPASDIYIEAVYEIVEQHNVIYKVGDNVIAQFSYYEGEKIDWTQAPQNVDINDECNEFNGWAIPKLGAMGESDIIVGPASYKQKQFTIFIHHNLSAAVQKEISGTCETDIAKELAQYKATLKADACLTFEDSEWLLFNGDVIPARLTSDIHVNINSQRVKHHVRFFAQQADKSGNLSDLLLWEADYGCDDVISLPTEAPDAGCQTFTGKWLINGKVIPATEPFKLGNYDLDAGDVRIDAQYKSVQHYVRYHLLDAGIDAAGEFDFEAAKDVYRDVVSCGATIQLRAAETAPDGFQFLGWFTYPEYTVMPNADVHVFGAIIPNQSYALMIFNGSDLLAYQNVPSGFNIKEQFDAATAKMKALGLLTGVEFLGWRERSNPTELIQTLDYMPARNLILEAVWQESVFTLTFYIDDEQESSVQVPAGSRLLNYVPDYDNECREVRWSEFIEREAVMPLQNLEIRVTSSPKVLVIDARSAIATQGSVAITDMPEGGITCDNPTALVEATALQGYHFVAWSDGSTANPHRIADIRDLVTYSGSRAVIIANFAPDAVPTIYNYNVEVGVNDSVMGYVVATVHFKANPASGAKTSWLTGEKGDEIAIELDGNNNIVRIADFTTETQRERMPSQFRKVSAKDGKINILGQDGKTVDIFDSHGQVVYSGPARSGIRVPQAGQYIIRIDKRMALIEVK